MSTVKSRKRPMARADTLRPTTTAPHLPRSNSPMKRPLKSMLLAGFHLPMVPRQALLPDNLKQLLIDYMASQNRDIALQQKQIEHLEDTLHRVGKHAHAAIQPLLKYGHKSYSEKMRLLDAANAAYTRARKDLDARLAVAQLDGDPTALGRILHKRVKGKYAMADSALDLQHAMSRFETAVAKGDFELAFHALIDLGRNIGKIDERLERGTKRRGISKWDLAFATVELAFLEKCKDPEWYHNRRLSGKFTAHLAEEFALEESPIKAVEKSTVRREFREWKKRQAALKASKRPTKTH